MTAAKLFGIVSSASIMVCLAVSSVSAQEATRGEIHGTVLDTSSGVLPGATITALHVATGETRTAVTSERGLYRLPALALGAQVITCELSGFRTVRREGVTLGLGQSLSVDFTMEVGTLEESITVTGAAPVIGTVKAEVAGLLLPDQIASLPLMGRNWMELGMIMPGVSSTITGVRGPSSGRDGQSNDAMIIDGVDSRNECCGRSSGSHSQDAIAEFKLITNNFSAEYGRSTSSVMTAVTKSGANKPSGAAFYFTRRQKLESPDHFSHTTDPLTYYQTGGTLGGPVLKDRLFFFTSFERQFDEGIGFSSTGFQELDSFKVPTRNKQNFFLAKGDWLPSRGQRVSVKYYKWDQNDMNGRSILGGARLGGAKTPWSVSDQLASNWGIVVNHNYSRSTWLNEFNFGYVWSDWLYTPKTGVPIPRGIRNPEIAIPYLVTPSFQMGTQTNLPQDGLEFKFDFKDTVSRFFNFKGDHELKMGVNIIHGRFDLAWFLLTRGQITFTGDPSNPFDFNSYPEPTRYLQGMYRPGETVSCPDKFRTEVSRLETQRLGSCAAYLPIPLDIYSGFVNDNWRLSPNLTMNLGVRYDFEKGPFLTDYVEKYKPQLNPQLPHPTRNDSNNVAPRVSIAYKPGGSDKTVLRTGAGVFFGSTVLNRSLNKLVNSGWGATQADVSFPTRQPCFAGHTLEEAITKNSALLLPGCGALNFEQIYASGRKSAETFDPNLQMDRSIHLSAGFGRELANNMGVEVDFVYQHMGPHGAGNDVNLFLDPATGGPKNPAIFGRPDPRFTSIVTYGDWARANRKALEVRFNKRFSHRYQAQANYTLNYMRDNVGGGWSSQPDNPFARDEWADSFNSQRHRLSVNGNVELPLGLELSGVFITYSGVAYDDRARGDIWNLGRGTSRGIRNAAGTITFLQRNSNRGEPFAKVDLRLAKWLKLGATRELGLIFEGFNVLNKANYFSYGDIQGSRTYKQPLRDLSPQFAARRGQLGIRYRF